MTVPWMAIIGAGLGAYQFDKDQKKENRDRRLAATTAQYRPWTGLAPGKVEDADAMSTVAAGAFGGYAQDQAMQRQESDDALTKAKIGYFERAGGSGGQTPATQSQMKLEGPPEPEGFRSAGGSDIDYLALLDMVNRNKTA